MAMEDVIETLAGMEICRGELTIHNWGSRQRQYSWVFFLWLYLDNNLWTKNEAKRWRYRWRVLLLYKGMWTIANNSILLGLCGAWFKCRRWNSVHPSASTWTGIIIFRRPIESHQSFIQLVYEPPVEMTAPGPFSLLGPGLTCRIFKEYFRNYFINQLLLVRRIFHGIFVHMQLFVMFLFHFFMEYSRNIWQVRPRP